jgi:hypothetical protein
VADKVLLLFFKGTFTSVFKGKKSKKSQNSRNQGFFLLFLLLGVRIRIRKNNDGSGSGGSKTYGSSGCGSTTQPTNYDPCDDFLNK